MCILNWRGRCHIIINITWKVDTYYIINNTNSAFGCLSKHLIYVPPFSPLNVAMQELTSPTTPATPRARAAPCRAGGPCRCQVRDHEVMRSWGHCHVWRLLQMWIVAPFCCTTATFPTFSTTLIISRDGPHVNMPLPCIRLLLPWHIFLINKSLFHNISITGPAGIGYGSIT